MERLFGAIPAVLSSVGSSAETREAIVFAAWKNCAGDLLNERTAALEFFEDRLIVAVADETWRRHLEDLCPQMLAKINQRLGQGTVTFIEFVIDAHAAKKRDVEQSEVEINAAANIDSSLVNASEAIADDELRRQFISTAAVYLARQEQRK